MLDHWYQTGVFPSTRGLKWYKRFSRILVPTVALRSTGHACGGRAETYIWDRPQGPGYVLVLSGGFQASPDLLTQLGD